MFWGGRMKKQNITLTIFGCMLISTGFVSNELEKLSYEKSHKEISRSLATVLMDQQEEDIQVSIMKDLDIYMNNMAELKTIPTPRKSAATINDIIAAINAGGSKRVDLVRSLNTAADKIDDLLINRMQLLKKLDQRSADLVDLKEVASLLEKDKEEQARVIDGLGQQVDDLNKQNKKLQSQLAQNSVKSQELADQDVEMLSQIIEEMSQKNIELGKKAEQGDLDINLLAEVIKDQNQIITDMQSELNTLLAAKASIESAKISVEEFEKVKLERDIAVCKNEELLASAEELQAKLNDLQAVAKKAEKAQESTDDDDKADEDSDDGDEELVAINKVSTKDLLKIINKRYEEDYITSKMMKALFAQQMGSSFFDTSSMYMQPQRRFESMVGHIDFMRNQNREFEYRRSFNESKYDEYSYRDSDFFNMKSSFPSYKEVRNSFHTQYIRGQEILVSPQESYNPANYDIMDRGFNFDRSDIFSAPSIGTSDFMPEPIIIS